MKSDIRIWSVKQHSKDGFICKDYEGTVVSMAMYGRKEKVEMTSAKEEYSYRVSSISFSSRRLYVQP